nr:reverse transcriptase domain-containing protein [Tanacetum cinerariifolium]
MPFGLKNAGATYQRLMDKAFESQIVRNIEVYVDDLVVKSYTDAEMMRDIEERFCTLRKVNMKLNPKKCSLGNDPDANLRYKPRVTWSGTKLLSDGKTSFVTSLRGKETSAVFPGTSCHGRYRPTHQASHVSYRRDYEALIAGLRIAARMGVKDVHVKENQEKDKIGSKPNKNGKRGKARKKILYGESKVHIEVLSVLWGNRLPIRTVRGRCLDDALNTFNSKMKIDLLCNPNGIMEVSMEEHASDWLRVVPISGLGQTMNGRVFAGDIYGDHALSCAGIIGIKHRRNVVRDTLVDICFRGMDVYVDLTGSSPLTQTWMVDFVPGRVVIEAAQHKRVKYETKCADIGYGFLPFSFSSFENLRRMQ